MSVRFFDKPLIKLHTKHTNAPGAHITDMVNRLEIPNSFKNANNAILLSRIKDGIQPQATWGWIRAMYLFLLQACHDLEAYASNCNEENFVKLVLDSENWLPLPNFLEVNENRIREGDPNVARDLRIAIYRERPFFKEVCDLLESEKVPPVAANETVVSTETEEVPMETRTMRTVHELNAVARVEEGRGEMTPSTSS